MTAERDKIEDEKLIFYLERRQQIDEWAKLADLESAAARRFLRDLTPDVLDMAKGRDPSISVENLTPSGGENLVGLWQPNWLNAASGSGEVMPRILIAIGWYKSVRFVVPGPYVGLRLGSSRDRTLRTELGRLVHERGLGVDGFPAGKPLGGIDVWVRYRHLSATNQRYWEDLGPFRKDLVNAIRDAYVEFAAAIDDALRSSPTTVL